MKLQITWFRLSNFYRLGYKKKVRRQISTLGKLFASVIASGRMTFNRIWFWFNIDISQRFIPFDQLLSHHRFKAMLVNKWILLFLKAREIVNKYITGTFVNFVVQKVKNWILKFAEYNNDEKCCRLGLIKRVYVQWWKCIWLPTSYSYFRFQI